MTIKIADKGRRSIAVVFADNSEDDSFLTDSPMKEPAYYLRLFINADLMLHYLKRLVHETADVKCMLAVTNLINSIEGNENE